MKIVITTSGIGSRLGDITKFTNKSLSFVGKKFVINHIIDTFLRTENVEFLITLGHYGDFVKQFLSLSYPDINFNYINIDNYKDEGSSLVYSLLKCKNIIKEPFIYSCCDAIFDENIDINFDRNTLFVADTNDSYRYSTISVNDNKILKIHNKGAKIFDYMYVGVAYIKDYSLFFELAENLYNSDKNNSQLSDMNVYQIMMDMNIVFNYKYIKKYFDIGSLDTYKKTCNYFKSEFDVLEKIEESICFLDNKVIKFFYNKKKNLDRIERLNYLNNLTPKILAVSDNFYSMEFINSKPLSKIYQSGIIYKLLNWTHKNLWSSEIEIDLNLFKDSCLKFYKDKTFSRIKKGLEEKTIIDYSKINGCFIEDIYSLLNKLDFNFLSDGKPGYFHGDFILDNILMKKEEFILIDWRENFGENKEYGDIYYDLAKLRHNIYFNHENIGKGLFEIKLDDDNTIVDMKCNYFLVNQIQEFEKFISEYNYDLRKIKIITSLIWINMAPLHSFPLSNFLFNLGKYNLFLNLQ